MVLSDAIIISESLANERRPKLLMSRSLSYLLSLFSSRFITKAIFLFILFWFSRGGERQGCPHTCGGGGLFKNNIAKDTCCRLGAVVELVSSFLKNCEGRRRSPWSKAGVVGVMKFLSIALVSS